MRSIFLAFTLTGALALGLAITLTMTAQTPLVHAAPGKNLQIYPKETDVAQIKKDMKGLAQSLGVKCDYCHDLEAMDKDSDMKKKARLMMKMVGTINANLKTNGFKQEVHCATCHAGQKKPKK